MKSVLVERSAGPAVRGPWAVGRAGGRSGGPGSSAAALGSAAGGVMCALVSAMSIPSALASMEGPKIFSGPVSKEASLEVDFKHLLAPA